MNNEETATIIIRTQVKKSIQATTSFHNLRDYRNGANDWIFEYSLEQDNLEIHKKYWQIVEEILKKFFT